eukprot:1277801-Amphidinium_carterae.2
MLLGERQALGARTLNFRILKVQLAQLVAELHRLPTAEVVVHSNVFYGLSQMYVSATVLLKCLGFGTFCNKYVKHEARRQEIARNNFPDICTMQETTAVQDVRMFLFWQNPMRIGAMSETKLPFHSASVGGHPSVSFQFVIHQLRLAADRPLFCFLDCDTIRDQLRRLAPKALQGVVSGLAHLLLSQKHPMRKAAKKM